jgi:DNA-binding MarR family transcriptional regulator
MAARQSPRRSGAGTAGSAEAVADRLHSAAIHLLRRLRRQDDAGGLSAPRLSALSVVVAVGPIAVGELAAAEQVRVPTISRLVDALEEDGLVRRVPDPGDRRIVRVEATAAGRALLHAGRRRRIAALAKDIGGLSAKERKALIGVIPLLERLAGS